MTAHTLTPTPHDQIDHLLATAVGRFGRPARIIDWNDPEGTPARILTVARMRDRVFSTGYQIDASLVATAIIDRVCDVGLIPRLL
jgi:hypothetical protein